MVANANADVDQATSGASGAAVGSDQQTAGSTGGTFSETGHKAATDVNTEESISSYNALAVKDAISLSGNVNNVALQILQNAVTQANNIVTNAQETANLVGKQAVRHTDIAIDREWNLDEQSIAAAATLARLIERLNNPTPPAA